MDDKIAVDEARRSVQHETVKSQVEGEVQAEIADRASAGPAPREAQKIDEVAGNGHELLAKARAWIIANPLAVQRWDVKGYQIPGGTPPSPQVAQMLAIAPALLRS